MSSSEKKLDPRIGLDVGTSRIVMARRVDNEIEYRSQLNAFVRIPASPLTASVLRKEGIPHTIDGSDVVIYGDQAEKFANIFHVETRRPMQNGALNPSEPDGPAVIREIISLLIGDQKARPGEKMCVSMPGSPLGSSDDLTFHESVVRQIVTDFGYEVSTINEGLAVVYSDLAESNYTGIGVSCGGGMCNVCFAYLSVPVVSFSISQAGDFVDTNTATATGEVATRIRMFKEKDFSFNGASGDKIQRALTIYYDEVIRHLVTAMNCAFSDNRALPKLDRPVPVVLSGGSSIPRGFRERFEKALRQSAFPVPVSDVLLAADPLHSTAKGALVSLLAD
ncbi:MAG TPA: hypothetical protein PLA43_03555 [Bryobacteraceae bacterium]|nr:hypothetical protein [Bryobacteraceae bacterium]HOL71357.1 hypothetical protein [Bryobacteraceae bacterium]HOQ47638.1 hypothetical protein [Bryobacteraceae bacterium]HPQ14469.1 hypothetical protein [Bryobacteraceae bacterium]HPU71006.1 hypothetical protein [Bryobacteraceae bacterium]